MKYLSVRYATSNENGCEEITIEYHRTFWQQIMCRKGTVEEFERPGQCWFNKKTGVPADARKHIDLEDIKHYIRTQTD